MIKCPSCGAELSFSADSQLVTCEYCRSTFDPNTLDTKVKKAQEQTYEGKSYLCSQCGAELLTFDETAITFCSYCGSQAMIESKMIKHNNPDFIIPFKKTKEECINAYKNKVSKSLFAPKRMKEEIVVNKFRGIYIPYCIYKLSFKGMSLHKGEKYKGRVGDYIYYNDYKITADVDAEYDGISFDLISNFSDKFSQAIPHNFKEAEQFNTNYLAGFYADAVDVDNVLYERAAKSIAGNDSIEQMLKRREYTRYGCKMPRINFIVTEKKVGMFPVYFLAIRDKKGENVNYAVVNGQTGKIVVDLPVDFKKYLITSLLLAIPIFLLVNNLLVILPHHICFIAVLFAVIGMIISVYHANKIYERENHFDDIGYFEDKQNENIDYVVETINSESNIQVVVSNLKIKLPKKNTFKYIYKSLFGIILGIIALFAEFVYDIYYYGIALIIFALVIWTFIDLIKYHNILVSTKLPQLNKRGGDENEK